MNDAHCCGEPEVVVITRSRGVPRASRRQRVCQVTSHEPHRVLVTATASQRPSQERVVDWHHVNSRAYGGSIRGSA